MTTYLFCRQLSRDYCCERGRKATSKQFKRKPPRGTSQQTRSRDKDAPGRRRDADLAVDVKSDEPFTSSSEAYISRRRPPPQSESQPQPQQQNSVKVFPVGAMAMPVPPPSIDQSDEIVSRIMRTATASEAQLKRQNSARQSRHNSHTQMRVQARAKIRQHKALERVPMFKHLDSSAIDSLLKATTYKRYAAGDVVCREGDVADRLFVIVTGTCGVTVSTGDVGKPLRLATLQELEVFGENSLSAFDNEKHETVALRKATVTAEGNEAEGNAFVTNFVQMLELNREVFHDLVDAGIIDKSVVASVHELGKRHERDTARRKSVSLTGGIGADEPSAEASTKTPPKDADAEMPKEVDAPTKTDYMTALSPSHMEKLQGIFNTFDVDRSGCLSAAEFTKLMAKLAKIHGHELEVSFEGFCNIVQAAGERSMPPPQ